VVQAFNRDLRRNPFFEGEVVAKRRHRNRDDRYGNKLEQASMKAHRTTISVLRFIDIVKSSPVGKPFRLTATRCVSWPRPTIVRHALIEPIKESVLWA
jgi:hypothetical protein